MTGKPRRAWVIYYDEPRPPYQDQEFGGVAPGEPLAIFNGNLGIAYIKRVVDAFVQRFNGNAEDIWDYGRSNRRPPYAANEYNNVAKRQTEVMGGYNPYVYGVYAEVTLIEATEDVPARLEWRRVEFVDPTDG